LLCADIIESQKPVSRLEKIKLLNDLQSGKRTLQDMRPCEAELWDQHSHNPEVFINDVTRETITAAQMQNKKRHTGDDILFITVLNYEHTPK
jgi:hypothetical protein